MINMKGTRATLGTRDISVPRYKSAEKCSARTNSLKICKLRMNYITVVEKSIVFSVH